MSAEPRVTTPGLPEDLRPAGECLPGPADAVLNGRSHPDER
jgi:hypothetical protein